MEEVPGQISQDRPFRDLVLLYVTAFLRALSTGLIGVLLGIYLAKLRFDAEQIGYVIAAGLAGGAVATARGNHQGREGLMPLTGY
jgi:hypothetical protein